MEQKRGGGDGGGGGGGGGGGREAGGGGDEGGGQLRAWREPQFVRDIRGAPPGERVKKMQISFHTLRLKQPTQSVNPILDQV